MGQSMGFSENYSAFSKDGGGLESALAKHVKDRWPDKTVGYVSKEYNLTESEAIKVVYGEASKNTLNKLLHHKRGGFPLFLRLLEDVTSTKLETYIEQQAERAEHERRSWEEEERRLARLQARLSGGRGVDGREG